MINGLLANGELFNSMQSGLIGNGLVRNKPSQNVFTSQAYLLQDPYWDNVVLFLEGNGINNSTIIYDSSKIPKNITKFGDTKISTAQGKYGGSSLYFDGNGDFLTVPISAFGTSNFTVECWVYDVGLGSLEYGGFISTASIGTTPQGFTLRRGSSFIGSSSANNAFSANSIPLNTWVHLALVRNGNNFSLYENGILYETIVATRNLNSTSLIIGDSYAVNRTSTFYYGGYLDSIRITEGIARYTANFNPETDTYLN